MAKLAEFTVLTVAILGVVMADGSRAQSPAVSLPRFYEEVTKLTTDGKLGQVLKKESIPTSIAGADAWRVAYVSSDTLERKTVVTALVIAPKGDVRRRGGQSSPGRTARRARPRTAVPPNWSIQRNRSISISLSAAMRGPTTACPELRPSSGRATP